MTANPSNCCGIETDACPNKIPDALNVTLENDCGSFTSPMAFSSGSSQSLMWKGLAKFQCRRLPPFPFDCIDCTVEVQLVYAVPFHTWSITLFGGDSRPAGVSCDPFVTGYENMTAPTCNGCGTALDVTITE
jgi:hypothetical protein